jgi:hypothetical protein
VCVGLFARYHFEIDLNPGVPGFRPSGHIRVRLTESFVSAHAGDCPSRDQGRPSAGFVFRDFSGPDAPCCQGPGASVPSAVSPFFVPAKRVIPLGGRQSLTAFPPLIAAEASRVACATLF